MVAFGKSPNAQRGSGTQGEKQRTSLPPYPSASSPSYTRLHPLQLFSSHSAFLCVRGFFCLLRVCFLLHVHLFIHLFVQTNIMNMCLQTFILNIFCSCIYVRYHKCLSGYHDRSCLIELLMPSPVKAKILSTKRRCQKNVSTLRRMATQMLERVQQEAKRWKTEKRQRTDF